MLWAALLIEPPPAPSASSTDALRGVATWCLQFTPRVALAGEDAVVMEVKASERLFGGRRALVERVRNESAELGVEQLAWAPTAAAAVALARSKISNGMTRPLPEVLDKLPLEALEAVAAHRGVLARLGCKTLGDVRALPRGGISRRFDKHVLLALDRAYGLQTEAHEWCLLPDSFQQRLELMSRVELAPALLFGARRLLVQMCGWLAARHAGTSAFTLRWWHDVMRSRSAGLHGQLTVRTAKPMRDIEHLCRLLAEHLAKVELLAPVGDLELTADEVEELDEISDTFLPALPEADESLSLVIERIAARLGPERVRRPVLQEDHRMEWMSHWQPAAEPAPKKMAHPSIFPQPSWMLPEPLKLAIRGHRPMYQGPLHLISGPHRTEGGWWHRSEDSSHNVVRDYWVGVSRHAGLLWLFQARLAGEETGGWYLQGIFA